jgi:hypothetical protein
MCLNPLHAFCMFKRCVTCWAALQYEPMLELCLLSSTALLHNVVCLVRCKCPASALMLTFTDHAAELPAAQL